jgi:hypothetical protein
VRTLVNILSTRILNFAIVFRVLTSARDIVRSQTSKSTKSSKSFFKSFKGIRVERDNEEMAALDVKISAALERFQVCACPVPPSRQTLTFLSG